MPTITVKLTVMAIAAVLVAGLSVGPSQAQTQTPPPGARPGDRDMTCESVAAERSAIEAEIAGRGASAARNQRVRSGFMGMARSVASAAAPSLLGGLGGSSYTGSIAASAAGHAVGAALNDSGATAAPVAPSTATATPDQQARLTRLSAIADYRQCPASGL